MLVPMGPVEEDAMRPVVPPPVFMIVVAVAVAPPNPLKLKL